MSEGRPWAAFVLATTRVKPHRACAGLLLISNTLHQISDAPPELFALDLRERLRVCKSIRCGEEADHIRPRRRRAFHLGRTSYARRTFEEKLHRDLQDIGALL